MAGRLLKWSDPREAVAILSARRGGPLVRMKIADPLDLDQIVKRILTNLLGGDDSSFSQYVTQPAFLKQIRSIISRSASLLPKPQFEAIGLLVGKNSSS